MLLRSVYPVAAGDTILVHAAAGGVGLILCQWAAALGATVIGTVSTDARPSWRGRMAAITRSSIREQDFVAEVERITGGAKLPVVYDSVGRDTFLRSLDCLRPRGLMVSFGQCVGAGRAVLARPAGAEGLAVPDPPDPVQLYRQPRASSKRSAAELFDVVARRARSRSRSGSASRSPDAAEAHRALEARDDRRIDDPDGLDAIVSPPPSLLATRQSKAPRLFA